jgi:autotransporter-associated beta strand protein
MNKSLLGILVFLASCHASSGVGLAIDYTWIGGHGMDFNVAANWSPTGVPNSSGDSAAIQNSAVVELAASNTVSALNLGPGTLDINSGGNLTTTQITGTGTIGFDGGRITASAASTSFMSTFNVLSAGGATIDTQSYDVTAGGMFVDLGGGFTGGLTKLGSGSLTLTANNSYSGPTTISAGVLQAADGVGLPANSLLRLDGGTLQPVSGMLTRDIGSASGEVQWTANGGGFSAGSAAGLSVTLSGGRGLVWGTDIQGTLKLSSPTAKGLVKFNNNIDLNGQDRVIEIDNPDTTMTYRGWLSGVISNSSTTPAGIIKTGPGRLYINTVDTYDGTTTVLDGFMAFAVKAPYGNYLATGGVTCFCGFSPTIKGLQVTGGGVEGLNKSILYSDTDYDIQGGELYGINLSNGKDSSNNVIVVGLTKTADTVANLEFPCTYTGTTTISEGTLALAKRIDYNADGTIKSINTGQISTSSLIVNDATFLIDDAAFTYKDVFYTHTVGTISGVGTTQLNAGAQLTASSISQGTITLAPGAILTIAAIPGGPTSDSVSVLPVPEPGVLILLATAGAAVLLLRRKTD